jgi:hypothetical protein
MEVVNMDKKEESFLKKLFRPSRTGCCSVQIISEDDEASDIGEKHKKAEKKEENQDKS